MGSLFEHHAALTNWTVEIALDTISISTRQGLSTIEAILKGQADDGMFFVLGVSLFLIQPLLK